MPPTRALVAASEAAGGPLNFARDDALLEAALASGDFVARVYAWSDPTISFGRNERTAGLYSRGKAEEQGIGVVRRRTGGRALLHHHELTYAIAGPATTADTLTATYLQLADVLIGALHRLKVPAEISAGTREENAEGAPCFATVTRGEITAHGRKLVASAQWRGGDAFLQHGSIMIHDHQALLNDTLEDGRSLRLGESATLDELVSPLPTSEHFADALADAFNERTGVAAERVAPGVLLDEGVVRSRIAHYLDPAWTWRR